MTFPKYLLRYSLSSCQFDARVTCCTLASLARPPESAIFSPVAEACAPFTFHLCPRRWCDFWVYRVKPAAGSCAAVCLQLVTEEGICSHLFPGSPKGKGVQGYRNLCLILAMVCIFSTLSFAQTAEVNNLFFWIWFHSNRKVRWVTYLQSTAAYREMNANCSDINCRFPSGTSGWSSEWWY